MNRHQTAHSPFLFRPTIALLGSLLMFFLAMPVSWASLPSHVVFVSLAGYNSCVGGAHQAHTSLFEHTTSLSSAVALRLGRHPATIPWASSCFRAGSPYDANIVLTTSHQVGGFYLPEKISYLAANGQVPPLVVLIGHSWGGQHAVETAIAVKDVLTNWSYHPGHEYLAGSKIMLVTIDAIDSHLCKQPIFGAQGGAACRSAPPSLFANDQALLKRASVNGPWLNFYQEAGILRSGPIPFFMPGPYLMQNFRMNYGISLAPHLAIARDPAVWDAILQNVLHQMM
jgi:hypothetical protein